MADPTPRPLTAPSAAAACASEWLATPLLAMEPAAAARLTALAQGVVAGTVVPTDLQALAPSDRPTRTTGGSVAVLDLVGPLTPSASLWTLFGVGTSVRQFMRDLSAAAADAAISSLVLYVDSPGGSVALVPEAAALLRSVRAVKPVSAVIGGCGCSAAYWIASNATSIAATTSALVGSLGVIAERVSLVRQLAADGIDVDVIATSPAKAWGHPATALGDAERAHLVARAQTINADLERDVALGRRVSVDVVRTRLGRGRRCADCVRRAGWTARTADGQCAPWTARRTGRGRAPTGDSVT
jgi:ClpP class serine protease